ncbi:hypothetical protein TCT1_22770 [Xenorhabdus sp. TCT-1]|uniref:Uncharacterized protein n=1 Tax=Xenorhabdus taiwanensis TaxID=3085177 RepID=A0ABM8JXD3_9GAMM|nr:hypothetical protein TCT1_22770 [Xenorhabdus sp. TCT-1]
MSVILFNKAKKESTESDTTTSLFFPIRDFKSSAKGMSCLYEEIKNFYLDDFLEFYLLLK